MMQNANVVYTEDELTTLLSAAEWKDTVCHKGM
jgi:hypothetical protein